MSPSAYHYHDEDDESSRFPASPASDSSRMSKSRRHVTITIILSSDYDVIYVNTCVCLIVFGCKPSYPDAS